MARHLVGGKGNIWVRRTQLQFVERQIANKTWDSGRARPSGCRGTRIRGALISQRDDSKREVAPQAGLEQQPSG